MKHRLIKSSASELAGHKAEETKWLQQLLSLAKQTGNDFYHSMALMEMGQHVFSCIQFKKPIKPPVVMTRGFNNGP
jgi:hypothetical protein